MESAIEEEEEDLFGLRKRRAARGLIALISSLSEEMVEEISSRSVTAYKRIKWSMVLLTWTCGLLTATNLVMMKCFGEIVKAGDFNEMPVLASTCLFFGGFGCFTLIYVLNVAMRYYDNIDVIPIF